MNKCERFSISLFTLLTLILVPLGCAPVVSLQQETTTGKQSISSVPTFTISAVGQTSSVADDADDPAIWFNAVNPANSLILGTNKAPSPRGALYVWTLDGKEKQVIDQIDRPNNVDVGYGFKYKGRLVDIAVVTERLKNRLRVFLINSSTGKLSDISSETETVVFAGEDGERAAPMGVALYKREDGEFFVFVSRKEGPAKGYVWQYRLFENTDGKVKVKKVRELGEPGDNQEIEAIAVDQSLGYVYIAVEEKGIQKYHADPNHAMAEELLATFATQGFEGDREGIAILETTEGKGYIVCCEQVKGGSKNWVYKREGEVRNPHDHSQAVAVFLSGADNTDGIEICNRSLGSLFPSGIYVAMNSKSRNFLLYQREELLKAIEKVTAK